MARYNCSLKRGENMFRVFLSLIFFVPAIAFSLPTDTDRPFRIVANTSVFNYKTGLDIYEGDVKIDQGTTHLTADRLVTQKNKQHKITLATAFGIKKLAEYRTVPALGDSLLYAKARIIQFYPINALVVLEKEVSVTQKENSFHGSLIIYNIKDQVVTAPGSKDGHSTIVIEPEQLK